VALARPELPWRRIAGAAAAGRVGVSAGRRGTVLVPLDGSPFAARALPYARAIADGQDGRVLALHIPPARGRAAAAAAADVVLRAAAAAADLIVMATHGRSALGRWVHGSASDAVARRASVPVLLVPPGCPERWADDPFPRVLVPLDGSAFAEAALEPATALARVLGAALLLLRVVPPPAYDSALVWVPVGANLLARMDEAQHYVDGVAYALRSAGQAAATCVAFGEPATAIADVASARGVRAVAMATHGRVGWRRLLRGSVATSTLLEAPRPVLLVRPAGPVAS
jgi:nucleotide-binding universal stress UspA family protein